MNVLFLQRLWPVYGGGETVTITLANEMVKRGWHVGVLYFKYNTREKLPFIDPRIDAQHILGVDCDQFHQNPSDANKAISFTKLYIVKHNVQFVIDQWWIPSYIKGLKGYNAVKIVKCLHTAFFTPRFDGSGFKACLRRMFKSWYLLHKKHSSIKDVTDYLPYVDKYIFLSEAFQKQYQMMNDDSEGLSLYSISNPLPYMINTDDAIVNHKKNIVLVVARMDEDTKRLSYVLNVWKKIESLDKYDSWVLKFVGEGHSLQSYKNMSKTLGLTRINFEGFKEPKPYYEEAKIFLMTSAIEGFGMTLVEAQQFGVVPIVMDTFLSLHDIVDDGINGLIIPNEDIEQFALKLQMLMSNDDIRKKMAINGIKICQKFSVVNIVNQWEKLFQSI